MVSCEKKELEEQDQHVGYLTVGVSQELKDIVTVKSGDEDVIYELDVYDAENNLDYHTDDHTEVSEANPIELLMGKYTVKATYGEMGTAFNSPRFGGENSVRIYAEKPASVNILCKMAKVKVSASFPDNADFDTMFPLCEFTVSDGTTPLVFSTSPDGSDPCSGDVRDTAYFELPQNKTLVYNLKLKNADGVNYTITDRIEQVAVAEHYHFDFKIGEKEDIAGALVLNVSLDGEYKEEFEHKINLNFDKTLMPSYSVNQEFDPVPSDGSIPVYPLGNDILKKFTFSAPRGIKSLVISHLNMPLLEEGLPQLTDFVGISPEEQVVMTELGIDAPSVEEGAVTAEIDITDFVKNLAITPDGQTYLMSFTVIDIYERYARCDFEFTIVSDIQAETMSPFPWSSFSILKGRYFSKVPPAGMTFQYKKKADENWSEIDPSQVVVDNATMTFTCMLNHLDVNTTYVYRATSDKDKADAKPAAEVEFTTYATEGTLKNMSLDDWYNEGDAYYPNASSNAEDWVWDTANGGTKSLSLYPTNPESTIVAVTGANKKAAKMVSAYKTKFAAGNIYTGKFSKVNLTQMGAELEWGVPFTSRPLALKGWFRYEPAAINYVSSGYEHLEGQPDLCQIQMFLTDWSSPFLVKAYSSGSTFVDFSADYILAHGEIVTNENTTSKPGAVNGYIPFVIPIVYRSLEQPTYIVISAAASRYGDYFTGGTGSTLYLDELEFVYDPEELTDEEFELVMKNVR